MKLVTRYDDPEAIGAQFAALTDEEQAKILSGWITEMLKTYESRFAVEMQLQHCRQHLTETELELLAVFTPEAST